MACDSPFYVQRFKSSLEKVPVACGKCPPCKQRRVNEWAFRLMEHEKRSVSSSFVTLTYDTRHVPISENNFMTLNKVDFQKYMKRLRKSLPGVKLSYYMCGEYGSKNHRPHYHMILFSSAVFDPEKISDAWELGTVHVGSVTGDSVAYTLKYIDKSNFQKKHSRDDRIPEFSLMSKNLGLDYLSQETKDYHRSHFDKLYLTKLSGHRVPMPRYYRNRIWNDSERSMQVDLVANALRVQEEKNRLAVYRQFGDRMSYEEYLDNSKQARYSNFYGSQKNRDL